MPRVTALPRGQSNGEIVTSFTDTVGTTPTTFSFDTQQEGLMVVNKGLTDISLTINGSTYTVQPGKSKRVPASFSFFTISSSSGVQQFEASAWDFEKNKVSVDAIQEPFVIAHRGGTDVYPENTMAAFRHIVAAGVRIIEPDVQTLYDGALGVMHDTTVDRTTSSTGNVADYDAYSFSKLVVDASTWLTGTQDTNPPLFEDLLREFGSSVVYVPESKDQKSAAKIAQTLIQYGLKKTAIIQSMSATDLAQAVPYGIPTMLVTSNYDPVIGKSQGFTYFGVPNDTTTDSYIESIINAGIKPVVYELTRKSDWDAWKAKGCVGVFSDDPVWTTGILTPRLKDPFARKTFYHGHISKSGVMMDGDRGLFLGTNRWGWTATSQEYVLQGWGSPIEKAAQSYSMQFTMTVEALNGSSDTTAWGSIAICSPTDHFSNTQSTSSNAYHILIRANGFVVFFRIIDGVATQLAQVGTPAIAVGGTATIKIDVSPTQVIVTRTDAGAPNVMTFNDTTHRGGYFFLNHSGLGVSFSNVSIT